MKTEYMNDLPYPNDLPQEVDRWVVKCIVNTLTDPISYANADLYPNVDMILKLLT